MPNELIFPWNIDVDAYKWQWAVQYISNRGIPATVWRPPADPRTDEQVVKLYGWLQSSRNWVVCFSSSPSYMRSLYYYLAATWACNMSQGYEELETRDIPRIAFEKDSDKEESIKDTPLLFLPYGEIGHASAAKAGSILASSILIKRKLSRRPLIADIFVTEKVTETEYLRYSKRMIDVYGNLALDLFIGEHVKNVWVSVPGKDIPCPSI